MTSLHSPLVFALGILLTMLSEVKAYVQCGENYCKGPTAHCCTFDHHQCCFYEWYNVWWSWLTLFLVLGALCLCIATCCRRRRVRSGYVVIAQHDAQPIYNAYADNQQPPSYNYEAPPPPYATVTSK